jgi:DNA-binding CsgD family transcriptional regulator
MASAHNLGPNPPGLVRQSWTDTYARLSAADREAPLDPPNLEQLAIAAYLIGRDAESLDILTRAHHAFLSQGAATRAARCAFWLGFWQLMRGEHAPGSGWIARARRLLDEGRQDCVEQGYLLLPAAIQLIAEGNAGAAHSKFVEAIKIGSRFGDLDLVNLATQGRGRALIKRGEITEGVALLDEVMIAVTSSELSPLVAGVIYCSVIEACFDIFDVRRAQEWTEALSHWCASQPEVVPYRGHCLVRRAQIMLLRGVWADAIDEAQRACERLSQPPGQRAIGAALYQLAELNRLRGNVAKAEEAYRATGEAGRMPQPGLSLLRLAQGRTDVAKAAMCRVVDEARDRGLRSRLLGAHVEILLAAGEVEAARHAADELSAIASDFATPFLRAVSAHATGAVLLAEGDAKAALATLREGCAIWHELEAPYEAARVSVLVGLACQKLGDVDGAQMELNAARRAFEQLGAAPDVARVDRLSEPGPPETSTTNALTTREVQVLRLVASGKTNKAIADELGISEKTVARHVSNIFTKLDLSSRAAATAYAFRHDLV